ncbi:MAG: amino acid adenylation domain-containing protein [Ignavibacteria bacterium]|jgi:amino acid adenylation domain-containing protein|nr:amino acid adenylation domain-containing protein [Ignavibacteria bacterium]MCU7501437.1 amino acid adenylation domain-containing protein [Ignavibacteria bacterium]MCU7516047.1 amino acid adenylation domain-containing protein [Ignavibacteria bacterium]
MMNSKEVEDIYPLSPMQQGMMFHSLLSPESGMYVEQFSCVISGKFDVVAFRLAWQQLVDEDAVLRTSFQSKGLKEPLQVVYRKVEMPFGILDWQSLTDYEREIEFENYCLTEQMKGFDLAKPPLLRFTIARAGKESYYFIWTFHHILLDGWSMPLLFREVLLRYEALANGRQYSFRPVKTYRDYIVWLKKQNLKEAEVFWRNALKGLEAPTLLGNKGGSGKEESCSDIKYSLPEEIMKGVQAFAVKNQLTMNTIVQGAWTMLLGAYTGQNDVVYGTTVSGRPVDLPGSENIIGLLINTLPVRSCILPEEPLCEWLGNLQAKLLEMRQYEYTPLSEIQKYSGIHTSQPLFDSLLVFENYPEDALKDSEIKGLQIEKLKTAERTNFPLVLVVVMSKSLEFRLIYEAGKIEPSAAGNMMQNLKALITSFIKTETRTLSDVEFISEAEKQEILKKSGHITGEKKHCLHELFELQVEKTPYNTAVIFKGQKLSYLELNKKSNQLSHYLIRKGIKKEALVGVIVEKSIEMIIAILGILKAGAAYVPIDPSLPAKRVSFICEDAKIREIITQSNFLDRLPGVSARKTCIDKFMEELIYEDANNPETGCLPENLAYVIYTSGSTGKPKGVLVMHSGACNFVRALSGSVNAEPWERWLQFFSLSFDGSVGDIFPPLISGAALIIPERMDLFDLKNLDKFIRDHAISTIFMTPTALSMMAENGVPCLKKIISGGEVCNKDLALALCREREFFNAYGPTEASVAVSLFKVNSSRENYDSLPIGRPLLNSKMFVLDQFLRIVPEGCIGELYVGGYGIVRGYLNNPELTAEKFVPNPYQTSPGERLYKTGDLVRLLPDGNFEFIKRIDEQVKIRGYRIELGEIESAIRKCDGVRDAIVKVTNGRGGESKISAYIVADEAEQFIVEKVKKELARNLPGYMVPSRVIVLKEFPLNSSGKIDKKALPEPEEEKLDNRQIYIAPKDTWECSLVLLFEEILQVHPVGVKDNFFDLGGHSLLAIRLMDLVQERLNRAIPLVTIYQNPTIEGLAPFLKDNGENKKSSLLMELKKSGDSEPLFFMHPSGGSVHWYSELAKLVDPGTPFFAMQALGIDGKEKLDDSIDVMASRYVGGILQKQPRGPYYIGGWSFGVIPAFEVARQLMALGAEVNMLALLDCGPFVPFEEPKDSAELLSDMFKKNFPIDAEFLRQMGEQERFTYAFKMAKKNGMIPFYVRLSEFSFYIHILKTMQQAWRKYKIKTYPGQITLFRSEESKADPALAADMCWGQFTSKPVNVIDVPGNHISMMQPPDVKVLAGKLNSLIRNFRENPDKISVK